MDLSIIDKILLIFKYFFSSFLGIEILLIGVLLLVFLILNIKRNVLIVKISIPIILIIIMLFISGGFHNYVMESIDACIKFIMNYYYFPSMALYYILSLIVVIVLIVTLLNDKIDIIKKYINYIFLSLFFILFLGVISYIINNNIELVLDYSIYENDLVLSFIQISNFIFFIWLLITCFWYLYKYFKKKFD